MKTYSKYKDSDIGLLQEIPDHWERKRFGFIVRFNKGLNITKADLRDVGIPCVSYGEVHSKFGFEVNPDIHTLKHVEEKYLSESPRALLSEGDFVFADTSEDVDGAGNFTYLNSKSRAFAGYHTIIAKPAKPIEYRFLAYQLDAAPNRAQIQNKVSGIKVFSISQSILKNLVLYLPPLAEQRAIATYLDRETAKIDTLIAKQEQLIALLEEKRQALISHAVTKGLDPNVKLKDSGVEWLGMVPQHWEVQKAKIFLRERDDRSVEGAEELLTVSHLTGITPRSEKDVNMIMAESLEDYKICHKGDVVINTMWAWMGAMGCSAIEGIVSPSYNVYKPILEDSIHIDFMDVLMRIPAFVTIATSRSKGIWSSRLRLYPEGFLQIEFALPPLSEQTAIMQYLRSQLSKMDNLRSKAIEGIELLREKRSALISAAVTGKIDVRHAGGAS
jgi:type I restriction enzyme S subunit